MWWFNPFWARSELELFKRCSVSQSCPTACNPMDQSTLVLPVPHHLPEFGQVHVRCIGNTIQPPHPLTFSSSTSKDVKSELKKLFLWLHYSLFTLLHSLPLEEPNLKVALFDCGSSRWWYDTWKYIILNNGLLLRRVNAIDKNHSLVRIKRNK